MGDSLPGDPYQALGLTKDATANTIKTAYRKAALRCHPDKTSDKSKIDEFHRIQQAYDILGDDEKRQKYDNTVKLAELRRDVYSQRQQGASQNWDSSRPSNTRRTERDSPAYDARGATTAGWSSRASPVFEERRPKAQSYPQPQPSSHSQPQPQAQAQSQTHHAQPPRPAQTRRRSPEDEYDSEPVDRSTSRKYDGYEAAARKPPPSRSARVDDARSSPKLDRTVPKEKDRRDAKKQRDRDHIQERGRKYSTAYQDLSDDSDDTYVSRRQDYKSDPRAPDDRRRREGRRSDDDSYDDRHRKYSNQEDLLRNYISKQRVDPMDRSPPPSAFRAENVTAEPRRSTSSTRPPSVANTRPAMVRRSSTRAASSQEPAKEAKSSRRASHKSPDVADADAPPPRRPASLSYSHSSPSDIRIPSSESRRPQSYDEYDDRRAPPRLNRADTMPAERPTAERNDSRRAAPARPSTDRERSDSSRSVRPSMPSRRSDAAPAHGSNLRHAETNDSGYSTSNSPNEATGPQISNGTKQYYYGRQSTEPEEMNVNEYGSVFREPGRARRSPSPPKKSAERGPPLSRSATYGVEAVERGPPPSRSASYGVEAAAAAAGPSTTARRPSLGSRTDSTSKTYGGASVRKPSLSRGSTAPPPLKTNVSDGHDGRFFGEIFNGGRTSSPVEISPKESVRRVPFTDVKYANDYRNADVRYANVGRKDHRGTRDGYVERESDAFLRRPKQRAALSVN